MRAIATPRFCNHEEQNNPLTNREEALIRDNVKTCYVQQIRTFALAAKAGHKRMLFEFLEGKDCRKLSQRPSTSMSSTKSRDLLLQSAHCRIDLSSSIYGRPTTRKINRDRFSSKGITGEHIFGESAPVTARDTKDDDSISKFYVKKIMLPQAATRLCAKADDYQKLIHEINTYIEKKSNNFPVDNLRSHPTLNPTSERTLNNLHNREDHISRVGGPKPPHEVSARSPVAKKPWRTPQTAYSDFFLPEDHYITGPVAFPFPPIEQSQPFCKFPPASGIDGPETNKVFSRQVTHNYERGRSFKGIFESKTIL